MKQPYIFTAMLALGAPFSAAFADSIEGTVKDAATGSPLAGAAISIIQGAGNDKLGGAVGEVKYQEIAGSNGAFTVANVAPGNYSATATYPGYKAAAQSGISVSAGQNTPLTLSLTRY